MIGQRWRDRVPTGRARPAGPAGPAKRARRTLSSGAVVLAVAWGLASITAPTASDAAGAASLPSGCAQATVGGTVTCTYSYTGGVQAFSVGAGVTSVTIAASGGHGATPGQGSPGVGGSGGLVTGTFPVNPNDVLDVTVGGDSGNFQGAFGYGNGAASDLSAIGAGGGGGSAVVTSENQVLVVAGGGGGGGIQSNCTTGGNGGSGGQNGSNGGKCGSTPGGAGGTSGGSTTTNGTTGPFGLGGGGGGGGGGFAGGSGGTGVSFDGGAEGFTGAGGGAGGTNFADASGTGVSTTGISSRAEGANGLVTIAYQPTTTVASLGLSPSDPAPIVPDQPQSFVATSFNAAGASIADVTAQTTFSIAPDGTCTGSECTATLAGPHTVTGTFDSGGGTLTATAALEVTAGPAGVVTASAGDDQSADAGQVFATDLGATVTDLFTNPRADTSVTFTVTSGSATFPGGLSTAAEMTNSEGVATAPTLTAGTGGPVTVTAAVTGVAPPAAYNLTVDQAPAITLQPASQIVGSGTAASFSAAASGFPSPTAQWQVSTNGGSSFSDIPGATSDSYSFTASQADNGDDYRAVFANGIGSNATTDVATLSVRTRPDIVTGGSATAVEHQPFSFTVRSVGSPTPTLTESGRLPAGIRVVTGTDGTATIEGTAALNTLGTYLLTWTASNSAGTEAEHFTLDVTLPQVPGSYHVVEENGTLFSYLSGALSLSAGFDPAAPIVGLAQSKGSGSWLVGADGGVFAMGGAPYEGSLPGLHVQPAAPIVGMAANPNGPGYWLVGADGGVFGFGGAPYFGSLPALHVQLSAPIVGMAANPNGPGYWLVGADGGVFGFGGAPYEGSLPGLHAHLSAPIVGMAANPLGSGYWLVGADGGVFGFGGAPYEGSLPGMHVQPFEPVRSLSPTPTGLGYTMFAADGGVFCFGDAPFLGSLPQVPAALRSPVVGGAIG